MSLSFFRDRLIVGSSSVSDDETPGTNSGSQFVADVTACLQECKNCTGLYVDFTGKYKVNCLCQCHKSNPSPKGIP